MEFDGNCWHMLIAHIPDDASVNRDKLVLLPSVGVMTSIVHHYESVCVANNSRSGKSHQMI